MFKIYKVLKGVFRKLYDKFGGLFFIFEKGLNYIYKLIRVFNMRFLKLLINVVNLRFYYDFEIYRVGLSFNI